MPKVAKPRKHGNRWRINWLNADGARQWATFATYKEAEAALHRNRADAEAIASGAAPRPPERHTFDELCNYWLEHRTPEKRSQKDDNSIIEAHLRPQLGTLALTEVTVQSVDRYRRLRKHLKPKTMHNHLTLLISMLNLAVELRWLVAPPRIKKPKLIEQEYTWLKTVDDIRKMLDAARAEDPGVMELYATAVYTGLRAGELLGLRWDDIDMVDRRLITVARSYDKPTKTGAIRHVPILDPLLPVLKAWKDRCATAVLFPNRAGKPQGPAARVLQEVFQRVLLAAELSGPGHPYEKDHITFHDLRHTFASHWVMRGGDLYKLQKILGHKSVQMTQRYAHLAPEAFADDWDRMADAVPKAGEVIEFARAADE